MYNHIGFKAVNALIRPYFWEPKITYKKFGANFEDFPALIFT